MLRNPNERELAAFARLHADADFAVIVNYLEENESALHKTAMGLKDDVALRWTQGATQTLGQLLDVVRQAPEAAHRARNR